MSGGLDALALKEEDVQKFLMDQYIFKRKNDGIHIVNLRRTWEKLLLAARAIAAIENPADVCVISARPYGQRAVLKFASATGATPIAGRFTPGTFTNQIQKAFREPRLLVVTDPRTDHQPVREASYVNIPVIALCNSDSPLRFVDIAIPCNNKGVHSIGLMWWMLSREVLRLRGTISRDKPWETMVDLYFYRDPEEAEKEEQEREAAKTQDAPDFNTAPADFNAAQPENWDNTPEDWGKDAAKPAAPGQQAAPQLGTAQPAATEDWAATDTGDWAATSPAAKPATPAAAPPAEEWGGATENWN